MIESEGLFVMDGRLTIQIAIVIAIEFDPDYDCDFDNQHRDATKESASTIRRMVKIFDPFLPCDLTKIHE